MYKTYQKLIAFILIITMIGCTTVPISSTIPGNQVIVDGNIYTASKADMDKGYLYVDRISYHLGNEYRDAKFVTPDQEMKVDWQTVLTIVGFVAIVGLVFAGVYYPSRNKNNYSTYINPGHNQNTTVLQSQSSRIKTYTLSDDKANHMPETITVNGNDITSSNSNGLRGTLNDHGYIRVTDINGNNYRGHIDSDGYGTLYDNNFNLYKIRPR